jgi:hypothetical protein
MNSGSGFSSGTRIDSEILAGSKPDSDSSFGTRIGFGPLCISSLAALL